MPSRCYYRVPDPKALGFNDSRTQSLYEREKMQIEMGKRRTAISGFRLHKTIPLMILGLILIWLVLPVCAASDDDGDGIRNNRDNCRNTPNGPDLGTCIAADYSMGGTCTSDADCSAGYNCDLNQRDTDGDGLGDVCDPCPNDFNNDVDGDLICAGTGFNPPNTGDNDNCPNTPNGPALGTCIDANYNTGGTCTSDADCSAGYNCDLNQKDTDGNNIGDACQGTSNGYSIQFEMPGYDTWLPNVIGETIQVNAFLKDPDGNTVRPDQPGMSFTVTQVTQNAGQYTNDATSYTTFDFDWSFHIRRQEITLTSKDYGGAVTIQAGANYTDASGATHTVSSDFTLPKDTDAIDLDGDGDKDDDLPDAWEMDKFGDLSHDSTGDEDDDGLINFEEYRGFKWGPPMVLISGCLPGSPGCDPITTTYQTDAYIPRGQTEHFRTDPKEIRDVFVKVKNYDFNLQNLSEGPPVDADTGYNVAGKVCPFALGAAFANAKVAVHAVSLNNPPGYTETLPIGDPCRGIIGGTNECWETGIDVILITNDLNNTHGVSDGNIDKDGIRDWDWDTKGESDIGDAYSYGTNTKTYQIPLDNYFNQRPYRDDTSIGGEAGQLDPIDSNTVEDKNDDGQPTGQEPALAGDPAVLEGDIYAGQNNFELDHTAFDVDADNKVENPTINNPNDTSTPAAINKYPHEYTEAQALKHTITHEVGHSVGMWHTTVDTCVMYELSPNWERDNNLSSSALGKLRIHND